MSSKKRKKDGVSTEMGVRNFVAKNDFNRGGVHEDKSKYNRRDKHRAGKSDLGREI